MAWPYLTPANLMLHHVTRISSYIVLRICFTHIFLVKPSGMDDSERNTVMPRPSAMQWDGSRAGVDLTKYQNGICYGTISISTPPKSFTGKLISVHP
jgi:hypothetical protein